MSAADDRQYDPLIWAYEFDQHGTGQKFEPSPDKLSALTKDRFYWFHLAYDSPKAENWLTHQEIEPLVVDAMTASETRPRALTVDEGFLIILRGVNKNQGDDPEDMISVRIWAKDNYIVTARRSGRRLVSLRLLSESIDLGNAPRSINDFVISLITHLTSQIHTVVEQSDENLATLEDLIEEVSSTVNRGQIVLLRQRVAGIRRFLAPQKEALDTVSRMRSFFSEEESYLIREQTDRTLRYIEELDLLKERLLVMQDELRSRISEQQNLRMYVLSIVSMIFLPLSFLTGVFGMNVAGLPGTETSSAFVLLSVAMVALAIVLMALMRYKKWL